MSSGSQVFTWIAAVAALVQITVAVAFPRHGWLSGISSAMPLPKSLKKSFLASAICTLWLTTQEFIGDSASMRLFSLAGGLLVLFLGAWATTAIIKALAIIRAGILVTIGYLLALTVTAPSLVACISDMLDAHHSVPWPLIAIAAMRGFAHDDHEKSTEKKASPVTTRTSTSKAERAPRSEPDLTSNTQRRGRGRLLVFFGWTAGTLGLLITFTGASLLKTTFLDASGQTTESAVWPRLSVIIAVMSIGSLLFSASPIALKRGRRHLHRRLSSFETLDKQRYLLYLRPFSVDATMASSPTDAPGWYTRSPFELPGLTREVFLLRQFHSLGRIIAVGQPGERLPELGAERGYLPIDDWKDTLSDLIRGAHAIIMTATPGAGTVWEFTEAIRVSTPTRLLLLIYNESDYYNFRDAVKRENADRSATEEGKFWPLLPDLPNLPPLEGHHKGMRWDFPLTGILHFTIDRRAHFTRFLPTLPYLRHVGTIRKLARRELKPVVDHVSQLREPQ